MSEKGYFPNLNGLRAIGAFIVLSSHFYFFRMLMGYQETQWFPIPGKIGVALFFALSGFLITSLLFRELEKTHTIRLKDFYIRRILRIWPLYYVILLLGFFVMNRIGIFKVPVLSDRMYQDLSLWNILNIILIIPNFTHYYVPYTDQRWSIIDEEMFYLIQPALLRIFRKRWTLVLCFCVIAFSSEIFRGLVGLLGLKEHLSPGVVQAVADQLGYLGCIAIGCIFSALYFKREAITKKWLFSKWTQIAVVAVILVMCAICYFVKHNELYFDLRWYSLLFGVVVINAALNPRTIYRLENRPLVFLGKISYGIYMYHMFCLGASFVIARAITRNFWGEYLIYATLGVALTILVSWASYRYIESFFLRLKPHGTKPPANPQQALSKSSAAQ
ncbi:MAG TPA: acyltransferase [Puia sp.]|jgi:peptidoglycan/LPS O-acetylase OafA/YrhL